MKTTLKRGVGRGARLNGNGHAVFPPGTVSPFTRYRQPPPPGRSGRSGLFRRDPDRDVLVGAALALGSPVAPICGSTSRCRGAGPFDGGEVAPEGAGRPASGPGGGRARARL